MYVCECACTWNREKGKRICEGLSDVHIGTRGYIDNRSRKKKKKIKKKRNKEFKKLEKKKKKEYLVRYLNTVLPGFLKAFSVI